LSKNGFVHIDTILARNHLLKEAEENGMQCHDSSM
jgi:hypothetical protein